MAVREIVVISGKGGTGKTTLTASLVPFLGPLVIADCDVDAPDLHILLNPVLQRTEAFSGGQKAVIRAEDCTSCGLCSSYCKFGAPDTFSVPPAIDAMKCEGCGVCRHVCPQHAVEMRDARTGEVFHSLTHYGPMKHARLVPGEETSGKLVTKVRSEARAAAEAAGIGTVLIDGSPGIGCNVISSVTGAALVLIVTEPTVSGLHDLKRVAELVSRFGSNIIVVINKFDLHLRMTKAIEEYCGDCKIPVGLRIPFSQKMVEAVTRKQIPSVVEKDFFDAAGWQGFIQTLVPN